MAESRHQGLARLWRATVNSFAGFGAAWRNEAAFRQECALAVVLLPAAFWVGRTGLQVSLLVTSVLLVLIVELLNSAVEAVVDRISRDHHDLSGRAKDMGSAAVMLSLLLLGATWGGVIWDRWLGNAPLVQ